MRAFLQAQQQGDDEKAYAYLSSAAKKRYNLERWQEQGSQVRITFSAINLLVGDTLLMGGASNAQNQVAAGTVKGNEATVRVTHMVPIRNTLRLVKENGKWVIDIHRSLSVDDGGGTTPRPTPNPPTTTTPSQPTPPVTPAVQDFSQFCQGNLRRIGIAFRVYALDHNGKLPSAANWTTELTPYLENTNLLKCPPDSPGISNYAMNSALSGATLADLANPGSRVLLYQTTGNAANVSGTGETQPAAAPFKSGYLVLYANGDVAFRATRPEVK